MTIGRSPDEIEEHRRLMYSGLPIVIDGKLQSSPKQIHKQEEDSMSKENITVEHIILQEFPNVFLRFGKEDIDRCMKAAEAAGKKTTPGSLVACVSQIRKKRSNGGELGPKPKPKGAPRARKEKEVAAPRGGQPFRESLPFCRSCNPNLNNCKTNMNQFRTA